LGIRRRLRIPLRTASQLLPHSSVTRRKIQSEADIKQSVQNRSAAARDHMVEQQLVRRGIHNPALLKAMREVPREAFVPAELKQFSYDDAPLPIGDGQTISQPYIVAAMIEAAGLEVSHRVLEVGAGSGYAAAVMSRIVNHVCAIERHAGLTAAAIKRTTSLGYANIEFRTGDGTKGWPEKAPFDAILVAASGPEVPSALRTQIAIGGRLIIPLDRGHRWQTLCCIVRRSEADFEEQDLGAVKFVPLISEDE
jgi:protein-L-isoaspartate(D-aspartate) O-methyltransferase